MRYIVMAFVIALFAMSQAQTHEIEQGAGVLCDTVAQLERFASLDANLEAVQTINADAKQNVCAMVEVQYVRGKRVGMSRNKLGAVELVEILVLQVKMHGQWSRINPEVQYTLFLVKEEEAHLHPSYFWSTHTGG